MKTSHLWRGAGVLLAAAAALWQAADRDIQDASFTRQLSHVPEPVRRRFAALAK